MAQHHRTLRDRLGFPDLDDVVHVHQTRIDRLAQRARIVAVFPVALTIGPGHARVDIAIHHRDDGLFMAAGEFHRLEIARGAIGQVFALDLGMGLRDLDRGDQIARGRVRIAKAEDLALGVLKLGDAAVLARDADRTIGEGAVQIGLHQRHIDRLRVGQIDLGIGRGAKPGHVDGATEKPLHHTVIIGGGKQLHRHAQGFLGIFAQAFVRIQPVLRVFTAQKADVELGDALGMGGRGKNGRGSQNGGKDLHGRLRLNPATPAGKGVRRPASRWRNLHRRAHRRGSRSRSRPR